MNIYLTSDIQSMTISAIAICKIIIQNESLNKYEKIVIKIPVKKMHASPVANVNSKACAIEKQLGVYGSIINEVDKKTEARNCA